MVQHFGSLKQDVHTVLDNNLQDISFVLVSKQVRQLKSKSIQKVKTIKNNMYWLTDLCLGVEQRLRRKL